MISLSHWGLFEVEAYANECFHSFQRAVASCKPRNTPMSFFVSRQDKPEDPKLHQFY